LVFIYLNSAFIIIISMVHQTKKITKYLNKHYDSIYKSASEGKQFNAQTIICKENPDKQKSVSDHDKEDVQPKTFKEASEMEKRGYLRSSLHSTVNQSVIQFPSNPVSPRGTNPIQINVDSSTNENISPISGSTYSTKINNSTSSTSYSDMNNQVTVTVHINPLPSSSFTVDNTHTRNLSIDSCLPITNEDSIRLDTNSLKDKDNDMTNSRRLTVPGNIFSQMTKTIQEEEDSIIRTTYVSIKKINPNLQSHGKQNKMSINKIVPESLHNTTMIASENNIIMQTTSLASPKHVNKGLGNFYKNNPPSNIFTSERSQTAPVSQFDKKSIKELASNKTSDSKSPDIKSNKPKADIKLSISESYKDSLNIINKTKRKLLLLVLYLGLLITAGSIYFIFEVISYVAKANHTELTTFTSTTHAPYYYIVGMIVVTILNLISVSYNFRKLKT
jgi:hypothetical protein